VFTLEDITVLIKPVKWLLGAISAVLNSRELPIIFRIWSTATGNLGFSKRCGRGDIGDVASEAVHVVYIDQISIIEPQGLDSLSSPPASAECIQKKAQMQPPSGQAGIL